MIAKWAGSLYDRSTRNRRESSPTSNGTVMEKIPVGEIVTVIAEGTEWWQVLDETTGQVGFMPGKYLVPVPQATVTADANAE